MFALKRIFPLNKDRYSEKSTRDQRDDDRPRPDRRSLSAKSITITDNLEEGSTDYPYRKRMSGCIALIDGYSYEFELILQYGSFDTNGYKERPCWSWIEVTGPSNDNPKRIVTAQISRDSPFKWLSVEQPLHPIAVKQGIRRWLDSKSSTKAKTKCNRVENEFLDLCVRNGQARKRAGQNNASRGDDHAQ